MVARPTTRFAIVGVQITLCDMTKETPSGGRTAELTSRHVWPTAVLVGVGTFANYIGWLGSDQTKTLGSDGYLHGPYEPWQIVGAVLVLVLIAGVAGWRRHPWTAVATATLVMTVSFSLTAATDPRSDGLWPIGAFIVAVGTFLGVGVVALVANAYGGGTAPGHSTPDWHRPPWIWVVIILMGCF
jgi:hypothetical protein